jgi:cytochrome c-type biogenesis protein CcmF
MHHWLMLPEFGHFALILALLISVGIGIMPFLSRAKIRMVQFSRQLTLLLFIIILVAYAILTIAFLTNDFSVTYVATNSSLSLPWWYKLCAVWGGHEGSMLLWVLVLSGWMSAVVLLSQKLPDEILIRTLSVLGWIAVGFLLFILLTSNPFARLLPNIPNNGRDLNPLLQDIGFLFHPPVLYMGYVGFSVPFALAISTLWINRKGMNGG